MKLPKFAYHRPDTLEEALSVLAEFGDESKVLAGGQSLIPLLALRLSQPAHIVDIGLIAGALEVPAAGGLRIGLGVRQADVELSPVVAKAAHLMHAAAPLVGHRAIRNRGTICGSLAHADPAAEMPAVALALEAEMLIRSASGERFVGAADFFDGYLSTAVGEDELLVEVRLPAWSAAARGAIREVCRRHGDFALVGGAAVVDFDDQRRVRRAAISLFGVASTPVRMAEAEAVLVGETPSADLFSAAAAQAAAQIDPPSDLHATSAYRKHLAGVVTRQCLEACAA
jgi:carbon-monoxide dehydrogenase medium subunit